MQLTLLRLYKIINQPSSLNQKEGWLAIDEEKNPSILIYQEEWAKKILKSNTLVPIDLLDFFKSVSGLNSSDLPSLNHFFIKTPLLLMGENHFRAKASLMPIYKLIEKDENKWADAFVSHFFMEHNDRKINPVSFAENFVRSFFKEIISRELDISADQIPDFPDDVLNISPKKTSLESNEKRLTNLILFLENKLYEKGRDLNEAWVFVTLSFMGTQALRSAVAYALTMDPEKNIWDDDLLFSKASPISVIGRTALSDISIDKLKIKKGQKFFIALSMINEASRDQAEISTQSMAFGSGPHKCPGRKISSIVMKALLNFWKIHHAEFLLDQVKFTRALILEAK